MKNIILFCMIIILNGCMEHREPKKIIMLNNQRVSSLDGLISATTPNNLPGNPFVALLGDYTGDLTLERKLSGLTERIRFYIKRDALSVPYIVNGEEYENFYMSKDYLGLFNKDINFQKWGEERLIRPQALMRMKSTGRISFKHQADYISGMKCSTIVSFSYYWEEHQNGYQEYDTMCGYYDTDNGKSVINATYLVNAKRDIKTGEITPVYTQEEQQFKQDMKAIFDSLVIHDMDREKMSKEGLLHDKQYNLESEFQ